MLQLMFDTLCHFDLQIHAQSALLVIGFFLFNRDDVQSRRQALDLAQQLQSSARSYFGYELNNSNVRIYLSEVLCVSSSHHFTQNPILCEMMIYQAFHAL
jgi:hypothetical protein